MRLAVLSDILNFLLALVFYCYGSDEVFDQGFPNSARLARINPFVAMFDPNRKKERALLFCGDHMNKDVLARHSCSAEWVKEELKKFSQVTDPKQVEKIRLYIGISKLTESFKTFFVPTGVAVPEEIWASQTNPYCEWSEVYHIKIRNRNDWQLFDCPVCGHEMMLRTQHDIGTEIKQVPPNGECDYCKTKFPNQTVRKPHLGQRNAEYKATTTIM